MSARDIVAMIAGLGGATATGLAIDPAMVAKLGPMLGAFVIYLELRWRPLWTSDASERTQLRTEIAALRAELAARKVTSPIATPALSPSPSGG